MQKIMFNDRYGLTKAVLEGRKTQTRRLAVHSHEDAEALNGLDLEAKDDAIRQYVIDKYSRYKKGETVAVAQSYSDIADDHCDGLGWRNKLFVKAELMPHRIRITDIRLEHLQDISDADCLKEGIIEDAPGVQYSFPTEIGFCGQYPFATPRAAYAALINKVSGKGTWERNPWIFVYDFELVK